MENKLQMLYNTLMLIETKGESTKLMSQCLNFVQQIRAEYISAQAEQTANQGKDGDAE